MDGMDGGGWLLESSRLVLPLATPTVGIIFIYTNFEFSVMGRVGDINFNNHRIDDNKQHRQMQRVTLITLTLIMLAQTCGRPEYFDLQDGLPNLWELYI